jgi:hypothetical protein
MGGWVARRLHAGINILLVSRSAILIKRTKKVPPDLRTLAPPERNTRGGKQLWLHRFSAEADQLQSPACFS